MLARTARVLGNATAARDFEARAGVARASFGRLYFDGEKGVFRDPMWVPADGTVVFQTEQALALTLALDLQDGYGAPDAPRRTRDGVAGGTRLSLVGARSVSTCRPVERDSA